MCLGVSNNRVDFFSSNANEGQRSMLSARNVLDQRLHAIGVSLHALERIGENLGLQLLECRLINFAGSSFFPLFFLHPLPGVVSFLDEGRRGFGVLSRCFRDLWLLIPRYLPQFLLGVRSDLAQQGWWQGTRIGTVQR